MRRSDLFRVRVAYDPSFKLISQQLGATQMADKRNPNSKATDDFAIVAEAWIDVPRSGVEEFETPPGDARPTEVRLPKGFTQGSEK